MNPENKWITFEVTTTTINAQALVEFLSHTTHTDFLAKAHDHVEAFNMSYGAGALISNFEDVGIKHNKLRCRHPACRSLKGKK